MAGHSKWANIKHRKGRADAVKGKMFTRVTKEIITAVKLGGVDPKVNTRLRLALQKAREVNMPSDNIERNIKKATSQDQAAFTPIIYEIYGHGGVGLIVEVMTDNKNRSASDIRIALNKRGGNLATPGAVMFNFEHKGVIEMLRNLEQEEALFLAVSEAGAEDFEVEDECIMITTPPELLYGVKEVVHHLSLTVESAELQYLPKVWAECSEEEEKSNQGLIEWLENLDDVDHVSHNMHLHKDLK
ncbi:YebC/PmpR family DNA-binding transcriptional regulator [Rhabdochlamydiaceae symbiont of Dictyostelium giganteum]|uniref:YebC/PmpR family DNA-binding transcriptional regulator n=1 Tax=Rhabdochlamydiaceae symbiont of Dictyostelium giganteum TaxID=3342349 RepID=UPI003851531D